MYSLNILKKSCKVAINESYIGQKFFMYSLDVHIKDSFVKQTYSRSSDKQIYHHPK